MTKRDNQFLARGRSHERRLPPDWTLLANESTQETISRVMGLGLDDIDQIRLVGEVVAQEISKLAYRYQVQARLVPIGVVGFQLRDYAEAIRDWTPRWRVSWIEDNRFQEKVFEVEQTEEAEQFVATKQDHVEEITRCLM